MCCPGRRRLGDWTGWNDTITWQVIMNGWFPVRLWWQPNQRGSLHFTPHLWWNGAERADRLTDVLHALFIDLADCQAVPPSPRTTTTTTTTHTHTHLPSGGKGCTEIVWKYESWGSKVTVCLFQTLIAATVSQLFQSFYHINWTLKVW